MGQTGKVRVSACAVVVLFSVLLLASSVDRARAADLSWLSGSTGDVVLGWSRHGSGGSASPDGSTRRILASGGSYIGYGALTAGLVPCPPQSGRSYYTPNCQSATGPVRPYTRGCSTISRCARG